MRLMAKWTLVVSTYRDEAVLEQNLLRSPAIAQAAELLVKRDFASVSKAYNHAIDESASDVVVFTHPDVYLPERFAASLDEALRWLEANDPQWGVLGLVGCEPGGRIAGFTYSVGLGSFVGGPFSVPARVRTLDEFVFVVRKGSGLRFDEALPGAQSQLCATDICLEAERRGLGVYVIPAFALHNSNGWSYLPVAFWKPYLFVRRKWSDVLPIRVPYARITRFAVPMVKNTLRGFWLRLRRGPGAHRSRSRAKDVVERYAALCAELGRIMELDWAAPMQSGSRADAEGSRRA